MFETRGTVWFRQRCESVLGSTLLQFGARIVGGLVVLAGLASIVLPLTGVTSHNLAPQLFGEAVSAMPWRVEPLTYIGLVLVIAGLGVTSLSYIVPGVMGRKGIHNRIDGGTVERWSQVTQQYFELFDHDLGRPLRRILGRERELRAIIQSSGVVIDPAVRELLDEIERLGSDGNSGHQTFQAASNPA